MQGSHHVIRINLCPATARTPKIRGKKKVRNVDAEKILFHDEKDIDVEGYEDKERNRDGQRGRSGGAWKSNGRTKCTNSMKRRSDTVHHRPD
jgi:hypothetical protein